VVRAAERGGTGGAQLAGVYRHGHLPRGPPR
jgi:hypothetical protein